jgi:hypothetical protein
VTFSPLYSSPPVCDSSVTLPMSVYIPAAMTGTATLISTQRARTSAMVVFVILLNPCFNEIHSFMVYFASM